MSRQASSESLLSESKWPAIGLVIISLATLLLIGRLVGCGTVSRSREQAQRGEPVELLQQMVAKYQAAETYSDDGQLQLSLTRHGQAARPQAWNAAVQFVRPGRLQVDAYNLHLVSDATAAEPLLLARVDDEESNNIDQQVVVQPAPAELTFDSLTLDPILFSQLIGRIQRPPVQLELLLGKNPFSTLLTSEVTLAWLDDASIAEYPCRRIEATAPEGKFVFWIDAQELLLRRLEYPAKVLLPDLAGDKSVSDAKLVAELTGATFKPRPNSLTFAFEMPPQAKRMRAFVMPVIALDARLLGRPVENFELMRLDGRKLTFADVAGKITVLFWYAHHSACEQPIQQFAAAAEKLSDDTQAFAICTEPPDVGDKSVGDQLKAWKVDLSPARDLKQHHASVFEVRELPAITLLDAEGRFQWLGSGPTAMAEFPEALSRLQKGENLAAEALERERLLREQYQRLVRAGGPQLNTGPAAATQPKRLKLTKKWKLDQLPAAGTIVTVSSDSEERALVIAGPRSVWEVAADGQVVGKHELALPEKSGGVTALRVWSGAEDRRTYAVFTPLQPTVQVFDDDWKLLFTYPSSDEDGSDDQGPPVRDVQLTDLDQNGEPELLIAFDESLGLHGVSLEGKRLWSNRAYTPLLSIATSHELPVIGRCAYLTGRGGICAITHDGHEGTPKDVPGWMIAHLFSSKFSNFKQAGYAAIASGSSGEPCLLGLNPLLEEQWNYPLSGNTFQQPADFVASGRLREGSQGEWVVGWGDGSLHIVSENGEFDDMFNTGIDIRGVGVLQAAGGPLLVVSSPNEVLTWEVRE